MKNIPYRRDGDTNLREVFDEFQAAAFVGVCSKTLRKLRQQEMIPFARVGGRIVYLRGQLIKWLARGGSSRK
jgi:hypothetical protein